jgi:hypothetical protein
VLLCAFSWVSPPLHPHHFAQSTETRLHSLTLTLAFVLPAFSTVLSAPAVASLRPFARVQIIAAGAWHNFVLWGLLALIGASLSTVNGKGADISQWGYVVIGVDSVRISVAEHAVAILSLSPRTPHYKPIYRREHSSLHWMTYLYRTLSSTIQQISGQPI